MAELNYNDLLKFNRKNLSRIAIDANEDILNYFTLLLDVGNFNISKLFRYFRYNDNLNAVIDLNTDIVYEDAEYDLAEFINFINICDEVSNLSEEYDSFLKKNNQLIILMLLN